MIGSDFLGDIFESEIIRGEPFGYVLSGSMSKVQDNEGSTLICHSLKCAAEISDSESILEKKFEPFLGD